MLVFMETNGNTEVKCPPVFAKSHRNISRCAIMNLICLVELFDTHISADFFNLLHPMSHAYSLPLFGLLTEKIYNCIAALFFLCCYLIISSVILWKMCNETIHVIV